MKKCLSVFIAAFFLVSITGVASASLINGGFEDGSLGWTTGGNVFFSPFPVSGMPTEGERFVQLNNGFPGGNEVLGGPSGSAIATALNVNVVAPGTFEGSYIYQDISAIGGTTISFDYNFLTNEDRRSYWNDMGVISISSLSDSSFIVWTIANTYSTLVNSNIGGYDLMTGTQSKSFTFPTTDNYRVGFAILDINNAFYQSSLYLDNVSIPEPTTMLLLGTGLVGLAGFGRKKFLKK